MKRIMIDRSLCMGCLNCVLACMCEQYANGKSIYELDLADKASEGCGYITVDQDNKPIPIFCRHCDEPECAAACMSGAMVKDPTTGLVTYTPEKCAACYMCVMSCPYGVLKPGAGDKKVMKCDFCKEHDTPCCVDNCPTGAIEVVEVKVR